MDVFRDISSALRQAASGCAFNFILVASFATVRGEFSAPLTAVLIGLGLAAAVGIFGLLIVRARSQVQQAPEAVPETF